MLNEDLHIPYIYITSHSDISTLEKVKLTGPSGYLLKPFKSESIYTSIEVALASFNSKNQDVETEKSIILKKGEEKLKVNYDEILFLESDGNYVNIHTVTTKFTERKTIKEFLDELSDHPFLRVHKSYAVNKKKIHHFTREEITPFLH